MNEGEQEVVVDDVIANVETNSINELLFELEDGTKFSFYDYSQDILDKTVSVSEDLELVNTKLDDLSVLSSEVKVINENVSTLSNDVVELTEVIKKILISIDSTFNAVIVLLVLLFVAYLVSFVLNLFKSSL